MYRYCLLLLLVTGCSAPPSGETGRVEHARDTGPVAAVVDTAEPHVASGTEEITIDKKTQAVRRDRASVALLDMELTRHYSDSITAGWFVADSAVGDLNRDGRTDRVLVLQSEPVPPLTAQRTLLVLLTRGGRDIEGVRCTTVIPIGAAADWYRGPMAPLDDPFEGVEVDNGCLDVHWSNVGNGGRWWTYRFRHQRGQFYLIGARHGEGSATHYTEYDYNLNTGVLHVRREIGEGDTPEVTTERHIRPMRSLPRLMDFQPGHLEPQKGIFF